nr:putative ribonuclease H-like domain-containing protein [Tanacetum cinerariifolium]
MPSFDSIVRAFASLGHDLDKGFFVGYSTNSKTFRVYNSRTRKVEENLHIKFLENKPLIPGDGPKWLFDIDTLTESMTYVPVIACTNFNDFARKGASFDAGQSSMETRPSQDYILMPLWNDGSPFNSSQKDSDGDNQDNDGPNTKSEIDNQEKPNDENTRIEAIRLFLAYASFMGFLVYHMDVNSAFLYRRIKEEVYVCQPSGFEDPDYPDKVYKVKKALYGLHQAPRAWYETLAKYLLDNRFRRGKIDQTLFIKRQKEDILLVQVYVDDIIFRSTKKELCTEFEKSDGIFISQDKYVDEILRKFKYEDVKPTSTPMDKEKALLKDSDGDDVDFHLYRSMIGSLMYLTSSRPDIMFVVCKYAKFDVTPKVSHLHAVKRISRYLKIHPKLGLWYPRDSSFHLVAYTNSDYAGASVDRKSTSGGCQFLGCRLISWQCKKQTVVATSTTEAEYVAAASCCGQVLWIQNQLLDYGLTFAGEAHHLWLSLILDKKMIKYELSNGFSGALLRTLDNGEIKLNATIDGHDKTITEASVRRHLKSADVDDEAITKEIHDGLGRATTTASSLGAEQGSGNISKTQTKATPSGPSSPRTSSKGGPGYHFIMGDNHVHARPERLSNLPNEPPLEEEFESPKKIKKKEMMQISLDEEIAQRFYEEEQAQILRDEEYAQEIQADEDLAQRMLVEERESLSIKERSRLLKEFIDKRKKMLDAKRAKEKRNKPPTQAQQRTYMSNYLKNMGGLFQWKVKAKQQILKQENEAQNKVKALKDLLKKNWDMTKGDMKIMFEPDDDDEVWKNHHSQELIEWKLYDSCEVHSLMLGEVSIHMLVEKKYPLPQDTLRKMLQWKLHVNYKVTEMAYELLRFIRSQLNS